MQEYCTWSIYIHRVYTLCTVHWGRDLYKHEIWNKTIHLDPSFCLFLRHRILSLPLFHFSFTSPSHSSYPTPCLSHIPALSSCPPFFLHSLSSFTPSSFALAYSLSLLFSPLLVSIIPPLFLLYSLLYCRCSFFFL